MNETKPDAPARGFAEIRRERVFEAINGERHYQEIKWGDLVDHPQSVGAYLTLMRVHLTRAENAWAGANNDMEALDCLRKVLAIGVACGEQHGLPPRNLAASDVFYADAAERIEELERRLEKALDILGADTQIDAEANFVALRQELDALQADNAELVAALETVIANAPEPYCAITRAVDAQCRAAIAKMRKP